MKNILLLAIALSLVSVASCAYELGFYLTFIGTSSGNTTGTSRAKAVSQETRTLIDNTYGLTYEERAFFGASAVWTSQFDTSVPKEIGNITFGITAPKGQQHVINFEQLSYQKIDQWHGYTHGAGFYNVTGGVGAFAGADGILAFTVTLNTTDNSFRRHVTGSLWIQGNPPPPPTEN
eukprot:Phypoly_transcript_19968.p1 GENE.Phypoly_transcript_19968~~Phypoly_transcript_19968.p1  ORF type:complete len:177 (+),score=28.97 Phypoly_transcript_19968:90-620(+)